MAEAVPIKEMDRMLLLNILDKTKVMASSRKYVRGKSMMLGWTAVRGWKTISKNTLQNRDLQEVANRIINEKFPDFRWSSIQINKDTISEPHKDKNNIGLSVALVLAGKKFDYTASGAASGSGDIAPGNPGALFYSDTKEIIAKVNEMNIFDGIREHLTQACNGDRY